MLCFLIFVSLILTRLSVFTFQHRSLLFQHSGLVCSFLLLLEADQLLCFLSLVYLVLTCLVEFTGQGQDLLL